MSNVNANNIKCIQNLPFGPSALLSTTKMPTLSLSFLRHLFLSCLKLRSQQYFLHLNKESSHQISILWKNKQTNKTMTCGMLPSGFYFALTLLRIMSYFFLIIENILLCIVQCTVHLQSYIPSFDLIFFSKIIIYFCLAYTMSTNCLFPFSELPLCAQSHKQR